LPEAPRDADSRSAPDTASASDAITPAPRWVKVFGGVLVALLLVLVVLHLAGGGFRGHGT